MLAIRARFAIRSNSEWGAAARRIVAAQDMRAARSVARRKNELRQHAQRWHQSQYHAIARESRMYLTKSETGMHYASR